MTLAGSSLNPYQPPTSSDPGPGAQGSNRKYFVLAAVGAGLASLYWAAMMLLLGASSVAVSGIQAVLPIVLVVLYAFRGYQLFKGDVAAARRILWLHGLGILAAAMRMIPGGDMVLILNGVKIAINVFGGITAWLALRSTGQT